MATGNEQDHDNDDNNATDYEPGNNNNVNLTIESSSPRARVVSPLQQQRVSVENFRRSSSHHTPTRTLRLSEQEHQRQQEESNRRITLESLQQRPRSNQRNRTPNRHDESPLNPDEFRRPPPSPQAAAAARLITIRPGAGRPVGTVAPLRIREEAQPRSTKQGPSHRKIRRYNNDHFDCLAAELAPTSTKVAQLLLKGKEDAHLYRNIYDPTEHTSQKMSRFMKDQQLQDLRGRFFEGELPGPDTRVPRNIKPKVPVGGELSGEDRLLRMDARLRRVVTRACTNSYPASRVVKTFETFVVQAFGTTPGSCLSDDWWQDVLLAPPTVTLNNTNDRTTVQFYFDPTNATGGFHRLLLHGVCQFHGLRAVSRMVHNIPIIGDGQESRALTVTGEATLAQDSVRLLDVLTPPTTTSALDIGPNKHVTNDPVVEVETLGSKLEDSWTVV